MSALADAIKKHAAMSEEEPEEDEEDESLEMLKVIAETLEKMNSPKKPASANVETSIGALM
jgi:hypothetical protein